MIRPLPPGWTRPVEAAEAAGVELSPRPEGAGWQGAEILERTPSGWWLRRTDMRTVGAQHVELFEPNGNKVMDTVRWR